MRGLKLFIVRDLLGVKPVAPYTGAWIETRREKKGDRLELVAPYTGAWIETIDCNKFRRSASSHPIRVRGLKLGKRGVGKIVIRRTLYGCVD